MNREIEIIEKHFKTKLGSGVNFDSEILKEKLLEEKIKNLIGHTGFAGETNYDEESYENMENLKIIVCALLKKINANYELIDDYRGSAKALGTQAKSILFDILDYIPEECIKESK